VPFIYRSVPLSVRTNLILINPQHQGRRLLLDGYIKKSRHYPVYNYLFTEYTPGTPPALGVWHGTDIAYGEELLVSFSLCRSASACDGVEIV